MRNKFSSKIELSYLLLVSSLLVFEAIRLVDGFTVGPIDSGLLKTEDM